MVDGFAEKLRSLDTLDKTHSLLLPEAAQEHISNSRKADQKVPHYRETFFGRLEINWY